MYSLIIGILRWKEIESLFSYACYVLHLNGDCSIIYHTYI